jgi:hypothetical protein
MVDAIFKDFPKDWQATVVMDWSNGFWDRMIEKGLMDKNGVENLQTPCYY